MSNPKILGFGIRIWKPGKFRHFLQFFKNLRDSAFFQDSRFFALGIFILRIGNFLSLVILIPGIRISLFRDSYRGFLDIFHRSSDFLPSEFHYSRMLTCISTLKNFEGSTDVSKPSTKIAFISQKVRLTTIRALN